MSNSKDKTRLAELAAQWQAQAKPGMLDKFTPADLRLLLEQFAPLQQLIRQIAVSEAHIDENSPTVPTSTTLSADSDEVITLREKVAALESELKRLQQQTAHDKQKLEQAAESLQDQNQQLKHYADSEAGLKKQLEQLGGQQEQLKASYEQAQTALSSSEQQLKQAQGAAAGSEQQVGRLEQEVVSLGEQLAQLHPSAELQFLRSDAALVNNLGLDLSVNDQQALIAMVSVLAQKDNLERLWDTLRERCDAEKRAASAPEQALLVVALSWYNHNWKSRPFQLLQPVPGASFDFEQQQKTKHHTDGEAIKQVWLPGLADGAGKLLRKALVLTH